MFIHEIRCPKCGKLIAKAYNNYKLENVLLWCPRCKQNLEVKDNKEIIIKEL